MPRAHSQRWKLEVNTKDCRPPPSSQEEARRDPLLQVLGGAGSPINTWSFWTFSLQNRDNPFPLFESTQLVGVCYHSPRNGRTASRRSNRAGPLSTGMQWGPAFVPASVWVGMFSPTCMSSPQEMKPLSVTSPCKNKVLIHNGFQSSIIQKGIHRRY